MQTVEQVRSWRGRVVVDHEGKKIGELADIYVDERNGEPWAAVLTGSHGERWSLAPLAGASPRGAQLRIDASRGRVTGAPNVAPGEQLTVAEERLLFEHYRRAYDAPAESAALRRAA